MTVYHGRHDIVVESLAVKGVGLHFDHMLLLNRDLLALVLPLTQQQPPDCLARAFNFLLRKRILWRVAHLSIEELVNECFSQRGLHSLGI